MKKKLFLICVTVGMILVICFIYHKRNSYSIRSGALYKGVEKVADVYENMQTEEQSKDNVEDFVYGVCGVHSSVNSRKNIFQTPDGSYCDIVRIQEEPTAAEMEEGVGKYDYFNICLLSTGKADIIIVPDNGTETNSFLDDPHLVRFLKKYIRSLYNSKNAVICIFGRWNDCRNSLI